MSPWRRSTVSEQKCKLKEGSTLVTGIDIILDRNLALATLTLNAYILQPATPFLQNNPGELHVHA